MVNSAFSILFGGGFLRGRFGGGLFRGFGGGLFRGGFGGRLFGRGFLGGVGDFLGRLLRGGLLGLLLREVGVGRERGEVKLKPLSLK